LDDDCTFLVNTVVWLRPAGRRRGTVMRRLHCRHRRQPV